MEISQTLGERAKSHGSYFERAKISQDLIRVMEKTPNWSLLDDDMRNSLLLFSDKISRILEGNPNFHDHWHDLVGYAKLVADRLAAPSEPTVGQQVQMIWGTPTGMVDDE